MNDSVNVRPLRLWDNPELRRFALITAAATILIAALSLLLWRQTAESAHRRAVARDLSIIGQLAVRHPELNMELARAYTRQATAEEMAAGAQAARQFGYDETLPLQLNRDMNQLLRRGSLGLLAVILLLSGTLLAAAVYTFRPLYRLAADYTFLAGRIMEGDFKTEWTRPAEGVFSQLAHQFQLMSDRLEHTLERLQEEKRSMKKLLSDISHQLKTPLAALQMFTELAQEDDLAQEKRKDFLAKGEAQIGRMEWLIRQLLTVARMEAGATKLNLGNHSLVETVREAVEPMLQQAGQSEVEVRFRYEADRTYHCLHDPAWLGEAVGNLVKNGIEHTPAGGLVEILLEETSVLSRILIRDNGEGIPPGELPQLFERFHRVNTSSPGGGTGIGLSLSKAIVEQHGGFISVRSSPGAGSTFTVTLPRSLTKS